MKIVVGLIILTDVYKYTKGKNLQLSSKDCIINFLKIRNIIFSEVLCFEEESVREQTRSNGKIELIRSMFEIWNQYLQDGYLSEP